MYIGFFALIVIAFFIEWRMESLIASKTETLNKRIAHLESYTYELLSEIQSRYDERIDALSDELIEIKLPLN